MWVSAMKRFSCSLARDHFTLVPAISIGRPASFSSSIASPHRAAIGREPRRFGADPRNRRRLLLDRPHEDVHGDLEKDGPGMPDTAWRIASSMYSGIRWV